MLRAATRPPGIDLVANHSQREVRALGSGAADFPHRLITCGANPGDEISDRTVGSPAHVWAISMQAISGPRQVDIAPEHVIRCTEICASLLPKAVICEIQLGVNRSHGWRGVTNDPLPGCLCCLNRGTLCSHDGSLFGLGWRTAVRIDKCAQCFGNDSCVERRAQVCGERRLSGAFATKDRNCGHRTFLPAPKGAYARVVRDDDAVSNKRADIVMDGEEIDTFLTQARTIVLCTIGPDGVPDPVPMWCVVDDGVLWMRTYAKSQKVRNIERDPRVSLLAETGDRYVELRGVQLTGPIEVVSDVDQICSVFAELMVKYEGLDRQFVSDTKDAYRQTAHKQVALRCRWTDPAWRVVSWDHRKQVGD